MNCELALNGDKSVYPVPEGLQELLADVTREVLRAQPDCIVPFVAEYLSALQTTREAAKEAIRIVDETLDTELTKYCVTLRTSPDKLLWAVNVIQKALRAYFVRKARSKRFRSSVKSSKLSRDSIKPDGKIDMTEFLRDYRITFLQAHYAAIVIQSAWRGYLTRKTLKTRMKPLGGLVVVDESKFEMEKYAPSWANSWLTLFEKPEPPVTPFVKGQMFPMKSPSRVFLPRREISVNRHTLQTLFYGDKEDDISCAVGSSRGSTPALAFSSKPPKYVKTTMEPMDEGYPEAHFEDESDYEENEEFENDLPATSSTSSLVEDAPGERQQSQKSLRPLKSDGSSTSKSSKIKSTTSVPTQSSDKFLVDGSQNSVQKVKPSSETKIARDWSDSEAEQMSSSEALEVTKSSRTATSSRDEYDESGSEFFDDDG